jgi:hypothetical protein
MAYNNGPKLITNNLQIYMDFSNPRCYPRTGTTINNLVGNSVGYLKNNVTFSTSNVGILTTGGANTGQQNNVGDRVDINTSTAGVDRFGAHNFSIFFWINQIASSGRIFSTGSAGTGTGNSDNCIWQMWVDTSQFFWWNSGGGSVNALTASGTWHTPGVWQLIGFTYSYNEGGSNIVRCYTNDTLAFSNSISTSTHSFVDRSGQTNLQWTLGGGYSSSCFNQNSSCRIGSFLLYNKTLSLQEIQQNYNATRSRFGV